MIDEKICAIEATTTGVAGPQVLTIDRATADISFGTLHLFPFSSFFFLSSSNQPTSSSLLFLFHLR